ncbi:hypothetical protein [Flexivirga meconopsidis]|uniref:hypothetical protein n=1 Tax=Flexivirga meconopsidis TaxID=2977121 RepID=UPI00224015C9|nr:hypothetical protein [Flexivirga meconopsidis]
MLSEYKSATAQSYLKRVRRIIRFIGESKQGLLDVRVAHWASGASPISSSEVVYSLNEFSKEEGTRMRRAARHDASEAVQRLSRFANSSETFQRWIRDALGTRRTIAEVALDIDADMSLRREIETVLGRDLSGNSTQRVRDAMTAATLTRREMTAFFILLAWRTGREPEVLRGVCERDLRIDQSRATVHLTKRRAGKRDTLVIENSGPSARTYRVLADLTECTTFARVTSGLTTIWCGQVLARGRVSIAPWNPRKYGIGQFNDDHQLGLTAPYDARRIRKSAKAIRARKGGSLLGAVDGDHSARTYAKHYRQVDSTMTAAGETIRRAQARVVTAAQSIAVFPKPAGQVAATSDDPQVAEVAGRVAGESVGVRSLHVCGCSDARSGPYTEIGELCIMPPIGCLGCPNAVVLEENLPQILIMRDHITELRDRAPDPVQFIARWGRGLDWIEAVVSHFSTDQIARARAKDETLHIPIDQRLGEDG